MTEALAMAATCDISGVVRGKAFPARDLPQRRKVGVGWVPANQSITPFDEISADDPYGPTGDLRLIPAENAEFRVALPNGRSPLHILLSDTTHTDGRAWENCPRAFLGRALKALHDDAGLTVNAAFEQELVLQGVPGVPLAFSVRGLRAADDFATTLVAAIREAGIAPDQFLPEYGAGQYEITQAPAIGLRAADEAVMVRLLVQEVAASFGLTSTMAPKLNPEGVGNGVHIHFSLLDDQGAPVTGPGVGETPLSAVAGQFAAGVLAHVDALCALTASGVPSYLRLVPHHWSAAYGCLGYRNREAALRICPLLELPGMDTAAQANLEYRAADATASPYVALGAVLFAGLDGIRRQLPMPPMVNEDPDAMSQARRAEIGLTRLPTSLEAALAALAADTYMSDCLPAGMRQAFLAMKRLEIATFADASPDEICQRYAAVY
ncbi:MAG: glutamine synthetase family protein [Alphaproteobacteria bacterium]